MDKQSLPLPRQATSASSTLSTSRSFLSSFTRRLHDEDSSNDPKGPFGLTTLSEPFEPSVADIFFVHGLRGGSASTWSKSEPGTFWPRDWLPLEPGFEDVRIHTFGYNADWNKESTLNIHDFAKSLLGAIKDCPAIPRGSNAPIIFIAHSMGGLVVKKAYILAHQFNEYEAIAARAKAVFFLATPHRGADLAETLSKILNLYSGARPFVADLHRNSLATQSINDEFPRHCTSLQIHSFYETNPMYSGVSKSLIVNKDSAILGLPNERTEYLNANHREVCRYSNASDRNYVTVRNAIAAVVADLRNDRRPSVVEKVNDVEQQRVINNLLDVSDAPEDDLLVVDQRRMIGSCEWLLKRRSFFEWESSLNGRVFWICAKPASGKSVLSGYVIRHLKRQGQHCAFFFFSHGDQIKSTISSFLCSIAWQMAQTQPEVLRFLLEVSTKEEHFNRHDYRSIWRKLFLEGILKIGIVQAQTIVVDALDECRNSSDLVPLLLKIAESHVRLFVTSRNRPDSLRLSRQAQASIISEEIQGNDTRDDMRLFLEANIHHLPLIEDHDRQDMVNQILFKSNNCFLWVSLVLRELEQVHTSTEIRTVLEEVPSDMDQLYCRILRNMSEAQYGKSLAKAILVWTACAARPLTTSELYHALQIDIQDTIDSIQKSISSVCGHLVFVDNQSRVQMIHLTAKEFLLHSAFESEFMIDRKEGHKRLGMTCLKYLCGSEMKSQRGRKLSAQNSRPKHSEFVVYAAHQLFEHILHTSSTDDEILSAIARFLSSTNVLSWIEYLAQHSSLHRLIQTGKTLRNFLQRRSKQVSPLGKEVMLLDSWSADLVRLVTKFGKNLLISPSSIHKLIPPFCPLESSIRKQFTGSARGISVNGLSATMWNDCLSTLYYPRERTSAITCSDMYFVVGLSNGQAIVYNESTCQEIRILRHDGPINILKFGRKADILAVSCIRRMYVYNTVSWEQLLTFELPAQCMALDFADDDKLLLAASKKNELLIWDLRIGELRDKEDWTTELEGLQTHTFRSPILAAFSIEQELLAVVYRGQDILIWSLEGERAHETYSKDVGLVKGEREIQSAMVAVRAIIFGNAPDTSLLAATYADGELVLFDMAEGTVKETIHANAQSLACSSDGQLLAGGDSNGTIQLFDFETLRFLYRINSEDYGIKALNFSTNGHRLLDIRGSHCRVWDPLVLIRHAEDEQQSDTVSVSTNPQEISMDHETEIIEITAIACHGDEEVFFCGKEDGSVALYDIKTGVQHAILFCHTRGVSIIALHFDSKSHFLCSTDSSSRVMIHKIEKAQNNWTTTDIALDYRAGEAVNQVFSNWGCSRMLLSSLTKDSLFVTTDATGTISQTLHWENRGSYRWASHPANESALILITNYEAHLYSWLTLTKLNLSTSITLASSIPPNLNIRSITPCFGGSVLATTFAPATNSPHRESKLILWNTADLTDNAKRIDSIPNSQAFAEHVEFLIGNYGQRIIYLDNNGWVYSVASRETFEQTRHFFVPADWLRSRSQLMLEVTKNGDVLFVKRDEVAVIRRGLEGSETGGSRTPLGKRPSLLSSRSA